MPEMLLVGADSTRSRYERWCDDSNLDLTPALSVHTVNYMSTASGPMTRTEIFLQGCERNCDGCFSPETHDITQGWQIPIRDLICMIAPNENSDNFTHRISICGGEPLMQYKNLLTFLYALRAASRDLDLCTPNVLMYTGFTLNEIETYSPFLRVLPMIDMLVDGPYLDSSNIMDEPTDFIGSGNQRFYLLKEGQALWEMPGRMANIACRNLAGARHLQGQSEYYRYQSEGKLYHE